MPTPSERLQKIINSRSVSEVVFKSTQVMTGGTLFFGAVKTKESTLAELPEDRDLQEALSDEIEETWDADAGKYRINHTVDSLWYKIKHVLTVEYEAVSTRCNATKRKTQNFINGIKVEDKHLPNYLIQTFIKVYSTDYSRMTGSEREALFEQFESLRRTYGK